MTHEESCSKYENIIWSLKDNYEAIKQKATKIILEGCKVYMAHSNGWTVSSISLCMYLLYCSELCNSKIWIFWICHLPLLSIRSFQFWTCQDELCWLLWHKKVNPVKFIYSMVSWKWEKSVYLLEQLWASFEWLHFISAFSLPTTVMMWKVPKARGL